MTMNNIYILISSAAPMIKATQQNFELWHDPLTAAIRFDMLRTKGLDVLKMPCPVNDMVHLVEWSGGNIYPIFRVDKVPATKNTYLLSIEISEQHSIQGEITIKKTPEIAINWRTGFKYGENPIVLSIATLTDIKAELVEAITNDLLKCL